MNPHRERNHGSIEHRESIKRMLQKTNVENRKRALRGQLQKMAANYDVNRGGWGSYSADFEAVEAFKNKKEYTSGPNPKISGAKWKYRSDGKTLFLHDTPVARHHKDGIEVSNGGHDTPLGAETHNALGINSRPSKHQENGMAIVGGKELDKNSSEWVLVKHKDILKEPVRLLTPDNMRKTKKKINPKYPLTKKLTRKRSNAGQYDFKESAIIQEREQGNEKVGNPLSKINIQPTDQHIVNDITGVNSPLGLKKRGTEAHHLLEYSGDGDVGRLLDLDKKKGDTRNNSIMIPSDAHKFISNFQKSSPATNLKRLRQMDSKIKQLKGKLQKMAALNSRILGNNDMEEKVGSYDWHTGEEVTIEQIHSRGDGRDVFAVAVTKDLDKNSDFREPEKYIDNDFKVKKLGLVKGIYINKKGMKEHDRTYLFHGSENEVQEQLNLHNGVNKGVAQEAAGKIYKDTDGIVKYESIPNKKYNNI